VLAAIIEMTDRDGRVLLARNTAWQGRMFALITGFMEAGETPRKASFARCWKKPAAHRRLQAGRRL
jgi:NADH pyrophosphatase NudC (nudix superfamily)